MFRALRCEARIDGEPCSVVGRLPVVLGREGDVVLRGASVSRRHCEIAGAVENGLVLRDLDSRAGTRLDGLAIGATVPLHDGQRVELGADVALSFAGAPDAATLSVERGLDRGRRIILIRSEWRTPLGAIRPTDDGFVLSPDAPVSLNGQRVAMPILLARGDRIDVSRHSLEIG